jgi:Fic family protein
MINNYTGTTFFDYYKTHNTKRDIKDDGVVVISPTDIAFVKSTKRKKLLDSFLIGHIERLAQSRYEIRSLTDIDFKKYLESKDYNESIAMSVYASARIEGEDIYVKDMKTAIIEVPDPEKTDEYELRKAGIRAMYQTYWYALTHEFPLEGGKAISSSFILELHRKMFEGTKPESAGKIKEKSNQMIRDDNVSLIFLSSELTPDYLNAICDSLNEKFNLAKESGAYSKIIAIAEFLVDFLTIHPFHDGNGRLARLLSTYLLEKAHFHFALFFSLDSIILEKRTEYYDALYSSQKNWGTIDEDISSWLKFYIEAVYMQYMNATTILQSHAISR